jgi:hypothetical protein
MFWVCIILPLDIYIIVILFNGLHPAGVTVWLMMHQQQQQLLDRRFGY